MNVLEWTNYFQSLAEENVSIRHSDTSKHFFIAEVEDFFQDIRSKAKFPAVMLESTLLDVNVGGANIFESVRTLAFTVIDNCRTDDYPAIVRTKSMCEDIAKSFIARLRYDISYDRLGSVRLLSAHFEPLENVPMHYYGQRVELTVSEPFCGYHKNDWDDEAR